MADGPQDGAPASIVGPTASATNAYAISYRLLGDRQLARGVAVTTADGWVDQEGGPPSGWLPGLAADAVATSLLAAEGADTDEVTEGGLRESLRRRLATEGPDDRAVLALHHLCGYSTEQVAEITGRSPEEVRSTCGALDPPPGVDWKDLGDPLARGVFEPVRRARRRRHRVPVLPVVAVVVAVAIAVWASQSSGPRPTLSPAPAEPTVRFADDVEPLPSAACPEDGATTTTTTTTTTTATTTTVPPATVSDETADGAAGAAPYRLAVPATDGPHPVVIGLPDFSQTAEQFQETSGIERAFPASVVATLDDPTATGPDADAAASVLDAVLSTQCVDLHRVHVVGYGLGAQSAGDLACTRSDSIATVSMVAGRAMPDPCDLDPAVSAMLTGNEDDQVLPPAGGYGPGAPTDDPTASEDSRPPAPAQAEVARAWAEAVDAGDVIVEAGEDDRLLERSTGTDGVKVISLIRPGGGHAWTASDVLQVAEFIDGIGRQS